MAILPTLKTYKKNKIKMLERDFAILLKPEQIEHINELKSEIQVDQYARTIIMSR